jgi:hypothetical protein
LKQEDRAFTIDLRKPIVIVLVKDERSVSSFVDAGEMENVERLEEQRKLQSKRGGMREKLCGQS